jgi:hypothetical protein
MDPATLAAVAISFVAPYLISLGKEAAKGAAGEAGKSVWTWIKGKLVSPLGAAAVAEAENAPQEPENMQALQAALAKALKADPDAAKALEEMLQKHGASTSSQSINIVGDGNIGGQADRQGSVNINVDRPRPSRE